MAGTKIDKPTLAEAGYVAVVNAAGDGYEPGAGVPLTSATVAAMGTKPAVRAVATGNVTLSAPQTIDGVALVAGNRVLLTGQSAPAENGVWVVAAGSWTRPSDWTGAATVAAGATIPVVGGTANARTQWVVTTTAAITVGTTAVTIAKVQAASGDVTGLASAITATRLDQLAAPNVDVSLASHKLTNVTDPVGNQDAATKASTAAAVAAHAAQASAAHAATAISFAAAGSIAATTVQAAIAELDSEALARAQTLRLDQFATPTSDLAMGSHKITGVTDPSSAQHAATKAYVDSGDAGKAGLAYSGLIGSRPTAAVGYRGQFALIYGGVAGRDSLQVCLKGADEGYDWIAIAQGDA